MKIIITIIKRWNWFLTIESLTFQSDKARTNPITTANKKNNEDTEYYFLAEGGFYKMNSNGSGVTLLSSMESDILYYRDEVYSQYSLTDSVTYYYNRDVLYVNDSQNNANTIYKYNLNSNTFFDTIIVEGAVKNINFY